MYTLLDNALVSILRAALTDAVIISDPERMAPYGKDGTSGVFAMPELVVEVKNTAQVHSLLVLANQYCFPVIPRGLGTGLAGGFLPVRGFVF